MNYRGSYRRLLQNSSDALLCAIEIYNNPTIRYRDESFVIILINAWELLAKAMISKSGGSIYYPKKRNEKYKTLNCADAIARSGHTKAWPKSIDHNAVMHNVDLLCEYRNEAVHFYGSDDFSVMIYSLGQASISNYCNVIKESFGRDIRKEVRWSIMPIGFNTPIDPVVYPRSAIEESSVPGGARMEIGAFLRKLSEAVADCEEHDHDLGRLLTVYDIHLQSVKKVSKADFVVGISEDSSGSTIVSNKMDPNTSHPMLPMMVVDAVNAKRKDLNFNSYDLLSVKFANSWDEIPRLYWDNKATGRRQWSMEIVGVICKMTRKDIDDCRKKYKEYKRRVKKEGR